MYTFLKSIKCYRDVWYGDGTAVLFEFQICSILEPRTLGFLTSNANFKKLWETNFLPSVLLEKYSVVFLLNSMQNFETFKRNCEP